MNSTKYNDGKDLPETKELAPKISKWLEERYGNAFKMWEGYNDLVWSRVTRTREFDDNIPFKRTQIYKMVLSALPELKLTLRKEIKVSGVTYFFFKELKTIGLTIGPERHSRGVFYISIEPIEGYMGMKHNITEAEKTVDELKKRKQLRLSAQKKLTPEERAAVGIS